MLNIKNILFPTDFSNCAAQALEHALFLAKQTGASVHLIHAIVLHQEDPHNPAYHFPDPVELQEKLGRVAKEMMHTTLQASSQNNENIDIIVEELRGYSTPHLILEYARSRDIDLIVMGTHGRRGLDYMFLGSVAQEVVREASCPVYTIRESEQPRLPQRIDTILSPIDFSAYSGAALSVALEAVRMYGAKLQILHVIEKAVYPSFYEPPPKSDTNLLELVQEEIARFYAESAGTEGGAEFNVVQGHVVHEILEFAKRKKVDLIVIATHGLSGLKHLLLGSVAEKIIRQAPCPVLTVKAFGKRLIQSRD